MPKGGWRSEGKGHLPIDNYRLIENSIVRREDVLGCEGERESERAREREREKHQR